MNQQYGAKEPIRERGLFLYAILVPCVMAVVSIVFYIVAVSDKTRIVTDPADYMQDYATDLALDYFGVGGGSGSGTGTTVIIVILVLIAVAALVFFAYLWSGVVRDINTMCEGDVQEAPLMHFVIPFVVGILILPFGLLFYMFYIFKMQDYMYRNANRYGIRLKWSPAFVLLFAMTINVIAFILIIISFNEMAKAYNSGSGYAAPMGGGYGAAGYSDAPGGYVAPPNNGVAGGSFQGTLVCTAGESAGASINMSDGDTVTLGRDPQLSDVILRNDKKISRRHCTITFRNGTFLVTDHSSNGIKLGNGQKVEHGRETPLGSQGVIKLSDQTEFRVQAN